MGLTIMRQKYHVTAFNMLWYLGTQKPPGGIKRFSFGQRGKYFNSWRTVHHP